MAKHVTTGCRDCKRCTNSGVNELGRKSGRASAALLTLGASEAAMAFTRNCDVCGHKLSLHTAQKQAATVAPVLSAPTPPTPAPAVQPAAGWYPDPSGSGRQRWWNGQAWTEDYSPAVQPAPAGPAAGWYPDPAGGSSQRWWDGLAWTEHAQP